MNMRLSGLLTVLFFSILTYCNEVDDLLTFTIAHETAFTVESTSPLNLPIEVGTPTVTTNSNQKFENNNTKASLVKDVKLTELQLSITSPSGKTFSFMKSVEIFISTSQANEVKIAWLEDFPTTATTVNLNVTNDKLDEYLKADSYNLRTRVVTDESLTQEVDIKANLQFKVTAAPL
jgi:hypothetical protein